MSALESIEPEPRMSGAIIHKGLIYTCGMVCEEGGESKGVREQTIAALAELDRVLALSKSDKHHILQMNAWVADIGTLAEMNAVYDEWVSKTMPPGEMNAVYDE
ncbi:Endoribonuclease L-PSP/chorismate mutase-like protein [Baffinella frigidus]|nr:Endoribonuclease L-PSP/chorismate mutase-like protein [Cryptophyta sp. CCMP2293]